MNLNQMPAARFLDCVKEDGIVEERPKNVDPVVSAMNDMLRQSGDEASRRSRHCTFETRKNYARGISSVGVSSLSGNGKNCIARDEFGVTFLQRGQTWPGLTP